MIPTINMPRLNIDKADFNGKYAKAADYSKLIEESCIIKLEGNKPIVYLNLEDDLLFTDLVGHLNRLKFNPSNRKATGKNNQSILVGGIPARVNRTSFCNVGSVLSKDEALHYKLCDEISQILEDVFEYFLPSWHKIAHHVFDEANINPDYQMAFSIFTTAIINKNSQQTFHYDNSNLKNALSAMLTLKNDVSGGYLVFPEYDFALKTSTGSLTFFYGKEILHGVSPIKYHSKNAYRYTIVFYTMKELAKCKSVKNEFKKG
jgi:hypothetical protein